MRSPSSPSAIAARKIEKRMLWSLLACVLLLVLALRWMEPRLVFVPTRGPVGAGPGETIHLHTDDGVQLVAWWVERPGASTAVLYLHGNGGSLAGREGVIAAIADATGGSVLALDWRGYGESEGRPSEAGVYADARAAWDWLVARVEARRVLIWGESMGGAPAAWLAQRVEPRGLVLQSTFTSVPDMSSRVVPLPGIRWLCSIRMDTARVVPELACWKLFVHSRADEIVPFAMGERLFELAREPKRALWLDAYRHNDRWDDAATLKRLQSLFAELP